MNKSKQSQLSLEWITPYNTGSFLIESFTREGISHLVDFFGFEKEPIYCSCEAFTIGKENPCKHIKSIKRKYEQHS